MPWSMATCLVAYLDPADGMLEWCNAGHLPPVLHEPGQTACWLNGPLSPPLGSRARVTCEQAGRRPGGPNCAASSTSNCARSPTCDGPPATYRPNSAQLDKEDIDGQFQLGLDTILDGIEARAASPE
jgi:hypothetical protein